MGIVFNISVYSKLAPLYAQSAREVQRSGFLEALMNQYGLWVGLGKRSMTMIDYACGVGALSQVSEPFFAFSRLELTGFAYVVVHGFVLVVSLC